MLWWLLGVVALAAAYVVMQQRRRHYAVRFTNLDLLASVAPRRPGWRRHVPAALMALALVSLIVSLARPVTEVRVPKDSATIVVVIDVSASMSATDVKPDRLSRRVTPRRSSSTRCRRGCASGSSSSTAGRGC
jgi:Ca-activated chloride channel family protein